MELVNLKMVKIAWRMTELVLINIGKVPENFIENSMMTKSMKLM